MTDRIEWPLGATWCTVRWCAAILGAVITATPLPVAWAQSVLIAPTAIVLTESRRSATVTLHNTGRTASDVSIGLSFGYPETDSLGQMRLVLQETPGDSMPSAVPLLAAYPSRVLLPPGASRVVRVVATEPLPFAHEHWARLVVTSRAAQTPGDEGRDTTAAGGGTGSPGMRMVRDTAAHVALTLEVRSILGVFYRPTAAQTALLASSPVARVHDGRLDARVTLTRTGTAAYVGTLRAVLRDSLGVAHGEAQVPLGVYYSLSPSVTFDLARVPRGSYTVEWRATTDRADVPSSLLTPSGEVSASLPVRIP